MTRRPWDLLQLILPIISGLSALIKPEILGLRVQKLPEVKSFPSFLLFLSFPKTTPLYFFSSHFTEITWGSIIFRGSKPYALSHSCIRLSCIWWNRSIKSCGKEQGGRSLARSYWLFSFADNLIQGIRYIQNISAWHKEHNRESAPYIIVKSRYAGNININKMVTCPAKDW